MGRNEGERRVKSFVRSIVIFVLVAVCFYGIFRGVLFAVERIGGTMEDREELTDELFDAMREGRALDPEGKRVVLTQKLLDVEYRDYYSLKQDFDKTLLFMFLAFGGVVIASCVLAFFLGLSHREKLIRRSIKALIPIPLVIMGIWLLMKTKWFKLPPAPKDVVCTACAVEITGKESKESKSSEDDGHSSTMYYYFHFVGKDGSDQTTTVLKDTFDAYKVHDEFYIAIAESEKETVYYRMFEPSEFMLEQSK